MDWTSARMRWLEALHAALCARCLFEKKMCKMQAELIFLLSSCFSRIFIAEPNFPEGLSPILRVHTCQLCPILSCAGFRMSEYGRTFHGYCATACRRGGAAPTCNGFGAFSSQRKSDGRFDAHRNIWSCLNNPNVCYVCFILLLPSRRMHLRGGAFSNTSFWVAAPAIWVVVVQMNGRWMRFCKECTCSKPNR